LFISETVVLSSDHEHPNVLQMVTRHINWGDTTTGAMILV